ncbi:glycogen debranching enzyme [Veronia nyctiphanis]|uniref:Glycogen debranching enzyme n=1 Tax=Veronia nyctiphanis TaxID=1278244 RepID=A0A4V1LTB6_9GAMM|nr:alpha-amylase family glycosyl hydrolase [Veronia nyctiphanis]RXJ74628.1 glycogen debranching enzyme [Veronia nyctiphanis]
MIEHFKQLGVTTLQLMPVTAAVDEHHLKQKKLTNFWGYNPVAWFAPDNRFAVDDPVTEMKTMVRELHRHGFEVVLDVVYNHTAESGEPGPVFHHKLLDPLFYLHGYEGEFQNFTGCGNTVDLSHPPALKTVMDSLRYWIEEFHIDGFRFDLAATLGRRGESFDNAGGFFHSVYQDPIVSQAKLIAEPWDIGPDGYQLGHFPMGWLECNDKYRDTLRSYWHFSGQGLGEFATRIMGSRDLFSAAVWPDKSSVNYIAYHDGYTLQDLVSYQHKHNLDNGEGNRDGHGDNRSCNHGIEGETKDSNIVALRERQKRNLIASLMFSFGVPHLLAVDSLSHSQKGNNNAYCQDNPISWPTWQLAERESDFLSWMEAIIALRKVYMMPLIRAFSGPHRHTNRVVWRKQSGQPMEWQDWESKQVIALHIGVGEKGQELIFLANPTSNNTKFELPNKPWRCLVDTRLGHIESPAQPLGENDYTLISHSMAILFSDK